MKKNPPFLLVRKQVEPKTSLDARAKNRSSSQDSEVHKSLIQKRGDTTLTGEKLQERQKKTLSAKRLLNKLPSDVHENFKATLRSTIGSVRTNPPQARQTFSASNLGANLELIVKDLNRGPKVIRVGILDLGSWIGGLPTLLERLNASQPIFTLFEVLAPIPSGLIKTPEGFSAWVKAQGLGNFSKAENRNAVSQIISDDFFKAADDIRTAVGVDLLVGITPVLVAGIHDNQIFKNHFSRICVDRILISTADLRDFADGAERPYEAAVGTLLVTALLIAINSNLGYHEDSGCLFDYNGDRSKLVGTIRDLHIESSCSDKMTLDQRAAALNMLSALKRMRLRKST